MLFSDKLVSKPYVVEFEDGSEMKVDAYDIQEAMFTGVLKRNRECGEGEGPSVVGARPDADVLRQRALDDGLFRRLVASIYTDLATPVEDPEGDPVEDPEGGGE